MSGLIVTTEPRHSARVCDPEQPAWSRFVQALWPLIRDPYSTTYAANVGEASFFDEAMGLRFVIRSFESSPYDLYLLVSAPETRLPGEGSSYQEMWRWAREQRAAHFLPLDVKYISYRAEPSAVQEYSSVSVQTQEARIPEAYIAVFEADETNLALVPKGSWEESTTVGYGVEPILTGGPAWLQPFTFESKHLCKALGNLIHSLRTPDSWYTNPSNGVALRGWLPQPTQSCAGIVPTAKESISALDSLERLRDAIRDAGGMFEPAFVERALFDVHGALAPPTQAARHEFELLDWELKFFTDEPIQAAAFQTGRSDPFTARRMWHVLWCECREGILCVTRDEMSLLLQPSTTRLRMTGDHRAGKGVRRYFNVGEFLDRHLFPSPPAALEHVREHASRARQARMHAIAGLTGEGINQGLPAEDAQRALRTLPARAVSDDPLGGLSGVQTSLPWVTGILNDQCRRARFGLCMPLDPRHPRGDHLMPALHWNEEDCEQYDRTGRMPCAVSDGRIRDTRSIVLLFLDLSVTTAALFRSQLAWRRRYWRKLIPNAHFIVVGSLLRRGLLESGTLRSSHYLLLPSEFLGSANYPDRVRRSTDWAQRTDGAHVFQRQYLADDLLPGAPTRGVVDFGDPFLSGDPVNLARYMLNLTDGTVFAELRKILEAAGEVAISNPKATTRNRAFDALKYHTTPLQVLQDVWDYGYNAQKLSLGSRRTNIAARKPHDHRAFRRRAKAPLRPATAMRVSG